MDPIYGSKMQQLHQAWRRGLILVRGEMIKRRSLPFPVFLYRMLIPKQQFVKMAEKNLFQISFSEMTGHCAFLFSAAAFLEKDILFLRLYAVCSIALSILFQFYREVPLWIPIRWNFLFIAINATMMALLLKDAHEANYLPEEQVKVFEEFFEKDYMSKVDFMHFMRCSERHLLPEKGHTVLKQDSLSTRVWLVVQGKCQVSRDGEAITECGPGFFLGEMGFVKWRDLRHELRLKASEEQEELDRMAKAAEGKKWKSGEELEKALSIACGADSPSGLPVKVGDFTTTFMNYGETATAKVGKLDGTKIWEDSEPHGALTLLHSKSKSSSKEAKAGVTKTSTTSSTSSPSSKPTFLTPWGAFLEPYVPTAVSTFFSEKFDLDSEPEVSSEGVMAAAGVKTWTDNVVLYSWKFSELNDLLEKHPTLAIVLERSFSSDLQKKMRTNDTKVKYKYVLLGALSNLEVQRNPKTNLREEKLDPNTLEFVKNIQVELGVTEEIHKRVVRELQCSPSMFEQANYFAKSPEYTGHDANDSTQNPRSSLEGAKRFIKSLK